MLYLVVGSSENWIPLGTFEGKFSLTNFLWVSVEMSPGTRQNCKDPDARVSSHNFFA